jgi:alcohol dehydrogenase YqhD (iron-dependent ADH family)
MVRGMARGWLVRGEGCRDRNTHTCTHPLSILYSFFLSKGLSVVIPKLKRVGVKLTVESCEIVIHL